MQVGALSLTDRYYRIPAYGPVEPVQRPAPVSGGSRRYQATQNEVASSIIPYRSETAQNTMIYSSSHLRINENTFDNAPLTKSAAHMRARARMAKSSAPSMARQTALAMQNTAKPAPKKEVAENADIDIKNKEPSMKNGGFSVMNMAELISNLGNYVDIYA